MGSFSEHHIDAAGYCTMVYIVSGAKVWWVQPAMDVAGLPVAPNSDWDIREGIWAPLYLLPGDILYVVGFVNPFFC